MTAALSPGADSGSAARRPPHKWVAHGLNNRFMYSWIAWGCSTLPLPVLRLIGVVGLTLGILFLRETVAGISDNYRAAFGFDRRRARRAARRLFYSYGLNTVDLFRVRGGGEAYAPRVTTHDEDDVVLKRLLAGGRGFLIVSGHVGNWEMGAVSLHRHHVKGAIVGQPEIDPEVHAIRCEVRGRLGVESIDIGETMTTALRVREAVDRGVAVAMVADRAYENDRIEVEFFGRPTPFLRSPALLARFCGCPILPSFFLRNADGTYRSFFGEPLDADPDLSPDEDARRLMTAVAKVVERAVREEPDQWFNFYRYWPDVGSVER